MDDGPCKEQKDEYEKAKKAFKAAGGEESRPSMAQVEDYQDITGKTKSRAASDAGTALNKAARALAECWQEHDAVADWKPSVYKMISGGIRAGRYKDQESLAVLTDLHVTRFELMPKEELQLQEELRKWLAEEEAKRRKPDTAG